MIIEIIGEGDTIREAQENARKLLNAPEYADITFETICQPSKKILGLFGGKKAQVKASYEKKDKEKKKQPAKAKAKKAEKKPAPKKAAEKKEEKPLPEKKQKAPLDAARLEAAKVACEAYVKEVTAKLLGQDVEVKSEIQEENTIFITLDSGDHDVDGVIIGHRGETLDAIQYLASLVANKGHDDYVRVTIDVANYREKRLMTLTALAHKQAKNALRTGRRITLEPMNPYERHIIHTAVQEIEGVGSHSIGSNVDRRVVITPDEAHMRRDNRRGGRRPSSSRSSKPAAAAEGREPKKDKTDAPLYGIVTKPTTEE